MSLGIKHLARCIKRLCSVLTRHLNELSQDQFNALDKAVPGVRVSQSALEVINHWKHIAQKPFGTELFEFVSFTIKPTSSIL